MVNHGITKINLMPWLKRSPLNPTYSANQKKDKAQTDPLSFVHHKHQYFYGSELLGVPEYQYENKIDVIKPKDKALLIEYLEMKEEEQKKKATAEAEAAAAALAGAGAGAKKVDPKKDAGKGAKAGGKGAVIADDKNAP